MLILIRRVHLRSGRNITRKMHAPPGVWPKGAGVFHPVFAEKTRLSEDEEVMKEAKEKTMALWPELRTPRL